MEATLTMRCTVKRPAAGATTPYGNPGKPTYSNHLTNRPCYLWSRTGREELGPVKSVRYEDLQMKVAVATDITEDDRIEGVTNEHGETVNANVLHIRSVITRPTHKLLLLEQAA